MIQSDRYVQLEQIASTDFSVVYKAFDNRLNRAVVLKIIKDKSRLKVARFKREIEILSKLDHPGVVPIYDFTAFGDHLYFVMKYISHESLDGLKERISMDNKLHIFKEILKIVQYIHSQDIVHRDIKPKHFLVSSQNRIYVIDFGISKVENNEYTKLTKTNDFIGTYDYSSPEQFVSEEEITRASDIYSLGVVFYELLTGKLPFSGNFKNLAYAHLNLPPPKMNLESNLLPYESICLKMLQKKPIDRYGSCQEILDDIEKIQDKKKISNPKRMKVFVLIFFLVFVIILPVIIHKNEIIKENYQKILNYISNLFNSKSEQKQPMPTRPDQEQGNTDKEDNTLEKNDEGLMDKNRSEDKTIPDEKNPEENIIIKEESSEDNLEFLNFKTTRDVNLRKEPTIESEKIERIPKNTKLKARKTVIKEALLKDKQEYDWFEIQSYKGKKGFVYGYYLKPVPIKTSP